MSAMPLVCDLGVYTCTGFPIQFALTTNVGVDPAPPAPAPSVPQQLRNLAAQLRDEHPRMRGLVKFLLFMAEHQSALISEVMTAVFNGEQVRSWYTLRAIIIEANRQKDNAGIPTRFSYGGWGPWRTVRRRDDPELSKSVAKPVLPDA